MEKNSIVVEISKEKDFVAVYDSYRIIGDPLYKFGVRHYCGRKNSAMTKDLIKLEMMCRMYSFRPTFKAIDIILISNVKRMQKLVRMVEIGMVLH